MKNKQLKCNLSDEDSVWPANRANLVILVSFMALVDGVHARVKAQSFAWNLDPEPSQIFYASSHTHSPSARLAISASGMTKKTSFESRKLSMEWLGVIMFITFG